MQNALNKVADDWERAAYEIRKEDAYAEHVTEDEKDQYLQEMINQAEEIRNGKVKSFTIWQRVNYELTGECVAFLSWQPFPTVR